MKVTFVNYYYDKDIPIEKYLDKYPTIYGWCKSLVDVGVPVTVYHRFKQNYSFNRDKIQFILVNDNLINDLKWYQNPKRFHKKIKENKHDIIHINSFNYSYQASLLKSSLPDSKIIIQHHAENPRKWIKQILIKKFTSLLDGFIFSSEEIYDNWLQKKIISKGKRFAEIMEGSSNFKFENKNSARSKTRLKGNPIFLWVGRLNENKDPIKVLSGFLMLLNDYPEAKLYMIFSEDNLKKHVLEFISQNSALKDSVILIGFLDHHLLHDYYNSADYFVLGSHYEGSGYSVVEAMSCGVVPIVTDIPSFRMITNNGKTGVLWKAGDSESLYSNAKNILEKDLNTESIKVLNQFNNNLSYSAIAEKAKIFYDSILAIKSIRNCKE